MNSKWFQESSAVLLFPIFCVVVLAGCSGTNTHKLTSIAITPATASIKAGGPRRRPNQRRAKTPARIGARAIRANKRLLPFR